MTLVTLSRNPPPLTNNKENVMKNLVMVMFTLVCSMFLAACGERIILDGIDAEPTPCGSVIAVKASVVDQDTKLAASVLRFTLVAKDSSGTSLTPSCANVLECILAVPSCTLVSGSVKSAGYVDQDFENVNLDRNATLKVLMAPKKTK
jgi:hypothetical protein